MDCPRCDKSFARRDSMLRHQHSKRCVALKAAASNPADTAAAKNTLIDNAQWVQSSSRWKFKHPATVLVSGPTGSGKTTTFLKLIDRGMFDPLPKHIVVLHGEEQAIYKKFPPGTKFIRGWSTAEIDNLPDDTLAIIDDLMSEVKDCKYMSKLFTKISHHRNITVVWLTQNLFPRGKECRDISLNAQYILLFPNPRDQAQIRYFAAQAFPGKSKEFVASFQKATATPFDPVLLNFRQDQPASDRILQKILSVQPQYIDL